MNSRDFGENGEKEFFLALNEMVISENTQESTYGRIVRELWPVMVRTATECVDSAGDQEHDLKRVQDLIYGIITGSLDVLMNCVANIARSECGNSDVPFALEWIPKIALFMNTKRNVWPTFYTYSVQDKNGINVGKYPSEGLFTSGEEAESVAKRRIKESMGNVTVENRFSTENGDGSTESVTFTIHNEDGEFIADCFVYPLRILR